ncbi:MAG TPA: hypothetical protein VGJ32_17470, partial [Solirubrobacteraceae bacterium]
MMVTTDGFRRRARSTNAPEVTPVAAAVAGPAAGAAGAGRFVGGTGTGTGVGGCLDSQAAAKTRTAMLTFERIDVFDPEVVQQTCQELDLGF